MVGRVRQPILCSSLSDFFLRQSDESVSHMMDSQIGKIFSSTLYIGEMLPTDLRIVFRGLAFSSRADCLFHARRAALNTINKTNNTAMNDEKVAPDAAPMNIATISAGFEKGDFLVREEQGNRVYFDFFEEVGPIEVTLSDLGASYT